MLTSKTFRDFSLNLSDDVLDVLCITKKKNKKHQLVTPNINVTLTKHKNTVLLHRLPGKSCFLGIKAPCCTLS